MSETTNQNPETVANVSAKRRRGVSNKTQSVSELRFHERDAARNNFLFIAHLEDVSVEWSTNADGKTFTGLKVPRVSLHFASNHTDKAQRRHVRQSLFPVESNVDTMEGGKDEWKVNNVLGWMKHLLDIFYLKGRQMTEAEEDALSLPFVDSTEEGEYIPIEPEEVLKGYEFVFRNFVAMMNGVFGLAENAVPHPCYKDANGNFIPIWIKLLRHIKRKNEWINVGQNGDLAFPQFIGAGVIELFKSGKEPLILRVDLSKESITPKQVKKEPSLGGIGPMASQGFIAPNFDADGMDASNDTAFNAAGVDMPF